MLKKAINNKIKISVGELRVGKTAKNLIKQTLDKSRLTYGDITIRFENEFAKAHGAQYALFTVSGTSALQVALHALKSIHGWKAGDEVIVPAITFVATSNVILQNNLSPKFVDVDPETCNIDISKIEAAITKKTRCIMPVHLFGYPCDMKAIMKIAKKYKLKVLVDSCETMLVSAQDKALGAAGDIVCFSTYSAHLLTTGVGGLMVTNNPKYATKMRSLMNHGRDTIYYNIDHDDDVDGDDMIFSMAERRFSFIDIGYSYRLTELEAALGIEELERLPSNVFNRKKNAEYLRENLEFTKKDLQIPNAIWIKNSACMMFPIIIKKESSIKRQDIITHLEKSGVETRYLMPLLNQPIYRKIFGNIEERYPIAKWINRNGFYIGCHQHLTASDLKHIVNSFKKYFV